MTLLASLEKRQALFVGTGEATANVIINAVFLVVFCLLPSSLRIP
jgi:hypothetical protein